MKAPRRTRAQAQADQWQIRGEHFAAYPPHGPPRRGLKVSSIRLIQTSSRPATLSRVGPGEDFDAVSGPPGYLGGRYAGVETMGHSGVTLVVRPLHEWSGELFWWQ